MSNYLANIAARATLGAPPVRPRLRGRYDPVASPGKGALDQSIVGLRFDRAPLDEIESSTPVEPHALERSARLNIDRPKPEQASPIEQAESEYTHLRTTGVQVAETRPLPVPIPDATIEAKPAAQSSSDRAYETAPAGKSSITAATGSPASPVIEVTTAIPKPRNHPEDASTGSKTLEQRQNVQPTQSLRTIEPPPRFYQDAPHRSVAERVIEREIQTVVVHENPPHVDSRVQSDPGSSRHRAAPTTEDKIITGEAGRAPIIIQPRVEPLAAFRSDRPSVHQPEQRVEPTVHVTIGRIELRAVQQPLQSSAKPRATQPVMNLDDYLRRRSQGSAR